MKKNLLSLGLMTLVALTIYCCKREITTANFKATNHPVYTDPNRVNINALKNGFQAALGANAGMARTNALGQLQFNLLNDLQVDWDSYHLKERPDGRVVQFQVPDLSLTTTAKLTEGKPILFRNKTSAVFLEFKTGERLTFIMKAVEELDSIHPYSVLKHLAYDEVPAGFNGNIYYFGLDKSFKAGYRYVNGKAVSTVSASADQSPHAGKAGGTRTNLANGSGECVVTDHYTYQCSWNGPSDDPYQNFMGCTYTFVGSTFENCDQPPPSLPGFPGDNNYGGGGGGGQTNPVLIKNAIKDPCLRAAVEQFLGSNIEGSIQNGLTDVYGISNSLDLYFTDSHDLSVTRDAQTAMFYNVNSSLVATAIQLNANILPNSAYEYLYVTILHEAGHALVNYYHSYSSDAEAENALALLYQQKIAAHMHARFPSMPPLHVEALAWGGLESTPYFQANVATIPGFAAAIKAINEAYRNHTEGSALPCNTTGSPGVLQ